jgi:tetratricopeptide (TPR) repeat protein
MERLGPNRVARALFKQFTRLVPDFGWRFSEDAVMALLRRFRFLFATEMLTEQSAELCDVFGVPPVQGRARPTRHDADMDGISREEVYDYSPLDRKIHQIILARGAERDISDELAYDHNAYLASLDGLKAKSREDWARRAYERLSRFLVKEGKLEAAHLYLALNGKTDEKYAPILDARVPGNKLADPVAVARSEHAKAKIYLRYGERKLAVACFEKAISFNPHYAGALSNFAVFLDRRGNHTRARRLAERALAVNPHDGRAKKLLEKNIA